MRCEHHHGAGESDDGDGHRAASREGKGAERGEHCRPQEQRQGGNVALDLLVGDGDEPPTGPFVHTRMRQIRLTEPYEVIEPELYALIRGDLDQQIEQPHDVGGPYPLAHVQKVA